MPLVLSATPATFERSPSGGEVVSFQLFDPRTVKDQAKPASVAEAKAALDRFCASLDPLQGWAASAYWLGHDPAPRGFKAAFERNEFVRKIKPRAAAA